MTTGFDEWYFQMLELCKQYGIDLKLVSNIAYYKREYYARGLRPKDVALTILVSRAEHYIGLIKELEPNFNFVSRYENRSGV